MSDGNDSDTVATGEFDQIQVALEVVISGHEILRLATDRGFQNVVVVGIATNLQITGGLRNRRPCRNKLNEQLNLAARILESPPQSRPVEDFENFGELRQRGYGTKISAPPTIDHLARWPGGFETRRPERWNQIDSRAGFGPRSRPKGMLTPFGNPI